MVSSKEKKLIYQVDNYKVSLKKIKNVFKFNLEDLGIKIRRELIIPICQKHDLIFSPTLYFSDKNGVLSLDFIEKFGLQPIIDLLKTNISESEYLVEYVDKVEGEDL